MPETALQSIIDLVNLCRVLQAIHTIISTRSEELEPLAWGSCIVPQDAEQSAKERVAAVLTVIVCPGYNVSFSQEFLLHGTVLIHETSSRVEALLHWKLSQNLLLMSFALEAVDRMILAFWILV
eukprot:2348845-Amphidinium_carterae.1